MNMNTIIQANFTHVIKTKSLDLPGGGEIQPCMPAGCWSRHDPGYSLPLLHILICDSQMKIKIGRFYVLYNFSYFSSTLYPAAVGVRVHSSNIDTQKAAGGRKTK